MSRLADEPPANGVVTCAQLQNWRPLSKVVDVGQASGGQFDMRHLGKIADAAHSPVGARVRLSGGAMEGQSAPATDQMFWQLKADSVARSAIPLTEIMAYEYPWSGNTDPAELFTLAGQHVGTVHFRSHASASPALQFRNYPRPGVMRRSAVLHHFDAYYSVLKGVKVKPIPHYWGAVRGSRKGANWFSPPRSRWTRRRPREATADGALAFCRCPRDQRRPA